MKTINFLTGNFLPQNCAGTNRVLSLVQKLEKKYKINLICITEKGKPQPKEKIEFSENITVYYINQKDYSGNKFFLRALYEIIYAYKLVKKSRTIASDLTIATSPFMFIIPLAAMFTKGIKIIDIRDLVWEYIDDDTIFKRFVKNMITNLMKKSIDRFDCATVTNDYEDRWIREHTKQTNIVKITNGIEKENFMQLINIAFDEEIPFTVTYIGNVGIAQNVQILVDIANEVKDISVNIVGDGNRYEFLKQYVAENCIDNVHLHGKVQREKIIDFYRKSTLLFAQLDKKFMSAMPSKLYEYASTGLPIAYAGEGQAKEFIEKLENTIVIEPRNKEQLKSAILAFKKSSTEISLKNREFIKEYYLREDQAAKMVEIVDHYISE